MPSYAFDPPPQPAAPILGEAALYPVRRILCVGRNYAAHRREMGGGDDPDPPFFFSKPRTRSCRQAATSPTRR